MKWFEKRLQEAKELMEQAAIIIEELRDEQQEKLDNMPESLQSSNRYEMMEERQTAFDDLYEEIENLTSNIDYIE